MIKLIFALHRRAGLSRSEFQRYWRENHAPLVQKHQGVLGILRYAQLHSIDHELDAGLRASRGGPEPFDGVAEISWKSLDDLTASLAAPAAQDAAQELLEDERRFIDLARSPIWLAEEHRVIGD